MLSILIVTKNEPHAQKYLKKAANASQQLQAELVICGDKCDVGIRVESKGYLESVLDECISYCNGDYIFRLDDDEYLSDALVLWLMEKKYIYSDVFAFPRCNVIEGDKFILNKPLFPDLQTRLTKAEKAGGRTEIHAGSPYGTGTVIPCAIMHDKFIVRSYEDRKAIAENYESVKPGCGMGDHYRAFSLWEDFYTEPRTRSIYGTNGLHSGQINDWQKYS